MKKIILAMAVTLMSTAIISCEKPNWNTVRDQVLAMPRDTALMYYWYSITQNSFAPSDTGFIAFLPNGYQKDVSTANLSIAIQNSYDQNRVWAGDGKGTLTEAMPTSGGGKRGLKNTQL